MIKYFFIFLFYTVTFSAFNQELWKRIDEPQNHFIRDIVAKEDGTIYFSIRGKFDIKLFNIFDKIDNYLSPNSQNIINNYPFNPEFLNQKSSLILDCDNSLVTSSYGELYKLNTNKLERIELMDTTLSSYVNEMSNVKVDKNCRVFFKESRGIFMMNERWNNTSLSTTRVFDQNAFVLNFFPYNDSVNYCITYRNGATDVYQYNSSSFISDKLVSIPFQVSTHSIITEQGYMYFAVEEELYFYKNKGKDLFAPIIDSTKNAHGKVLGIFKSQSDNSIICYKEPYLYITYDTCKTWHKLDKFSNKFPINGGIDKFYYWDTNHAVVLSSQPNCELRELYVINSQKSTWTQVKLDQSNHNFTEITNYNNEFIAKNECSYIKSVDGGRNWTYLNRINKINDADFMKFISLQSSGPIRFSFNYRKDTLYRSIDFGQTWNYNTIIRGISKIFHLSPTELMAVALSNPAVGNILDLYYSNDSGDNWSLVHTGFKSNLNSLLKSDKNGFFYMVLYNSNISEVYISTDKGRTWKLDNRFPKFYINDLFFENDGRCIIHAQDTNSIIDIYATYDFITYAKLDSQPDNHYFSIVRPLGSGKFICAANNLWESIKGIFYTDDDGKNWKDLTFNLPDFHSKEKYNIVNDMIIDDEGYLNISLMYDGFWKYNTQLVSSTNVKLDKDIDIYPNPVTDNLIVRLSDNYIGQKLRFEVLDVLGRVVISSVMNGSNIINVSSLSVGTYSVRLLSKDGSICTKKILKY